MFYNPCHFLRGSSFVDWIHTIHIRDYHYKSVLSHTYLYECIFRIVYTIIIRSGIHYNLEVFKFYMYYFFTYPHFRQLSLIHAYLQVLLYTEHTWLYGSVHMVSSGILGCHTHCFLLYPKYFCFFHPFCTYMVIFLYEKHITVTHFLFGHQYIYLYPSLL